MLRVVVVVALLLTFPLFVFEAVCNTHLPQLFAHTFKTVAVWQAHNLDVIVKTFCPCKSQEPESPNPIKAQPDAERMLKQRLRQSVSSFGSFNRSFHNNSFISSGGPDEQDANGRSACAPPTTHTRGLRLQCLHPSHSLTLEVFGQCVCYHSVKEGTSPLPSASEGQTHRAGRATVGSSLSSDELASLLTVVSASFPEASFSIQFCNALNNTDKFLENLMIL